MFHFVGLSSFAGQDCLNPSLGQIDNIQETRLSNAIFDQFNTTKNVTELFDTSLPTEWDYDTIMDATFDGDTGAGNVEFALNQITEVKIKRRVRGTFDWLTLKSISIHSVSDLSFIFEDRTNTHGLEYEYAFVPVLNNAEGDYIINSILSKLEGVFIGDSETCYRFLYDVQYGTNARKINVGTFQPLGRKYPVIISNGLLSYDTGSISSVVLNDEFEDTGVIDSAKTNEKKRKLKELLADKKPKILRDWTGAKWLVAITDDVQISYAESSGLRVPTISVTWTEIGDADNQADLYNCGIVNTLS
ncbi:MAG TPA: hypothetical protein DCW90_19725 [Lachnospiraceae bacterium]|nr:hypothetical protein [Lachnospiraceae bacterium]